MARWLPITFGPAVLVVGVLLGIVCGEVATAQAPKPSGTQVLNQGIYSGGITPSDTLTFTSPTRAIYNGGSAACNIAGALANDTNTVSTPTMFQNLQPGEILPFSFSRIYATNTSCTNIVGIW